MSSSSHPLPGPARAPLANRRIELSYNAVIAQPIEGLGASTPRRPALQHVRLVIGLQFVDGHHALLEAWLATPAGQRDIVRRQPIHCEVLVDDQRELLHVDGRLDNQRLIALTMSTAPDTADDGLLYAHTTLLAEAGFAPGACDPPTGRLLQAEADAATA
jgi:hypothetical protein